MRQDSCSLNICRQRSPRVQLCDPGSHTQHQDVFMKPDETSVNVFETLRYRCSRVGRCLMGRYDTSVSSTYSGTEQLSKRALVKVAKLFHSAPRPSYDGRLSSSSRSTHILHAASARVGNTFSCFSTKNMLWIYLRSSCLCGTWYHVQRHVALRSLNVQLDC